MSCPDINKFRKLLLGIDQAHEIDKDKENPLRYDVWKTKSEDLRKMIKDLTPDQLPDKNSVSIFDKLERTFKRIGNNEDKADKFVEDIINSKDNIQMSIALYELMESAKGEADKTRKYNIKMQNILSDGILPSVLLARIASSIGRKIMFQQGFRIANSEEVKVTPEEVEVLYVHAGMAALKKLESKGYVSFHTGNVIKDYIYEKDKNKAFPDTNRIEGDVEVVTLNSKTLGIKENSQEALYFTNRSKSNISDTPFSSIVDMLSAARQVTQPSKYRLPDRSGVMTDEQYSDVDAHGISLDEITDKVRKQLYKHDLKVNSSVHEFFTLLHHEVNETGLPASKILKEIFNGKPEILKSLFGLKDSGLFSVDKVESISGQNLSKTTALDDIAEYYNLLMENDKPASLHMPLKVGRNMRLYYLNSVLNAHTSKQSRYMISTGTQNIKKGSDNEKFLIHQVANAFGSSITYKDILEGTNQKLEDALEVFKDFKDATTLKGKVNVLSHLPKFFRNLDYVILTTSLQAVQDIRNPVKGVIKTEYVVSADAIASGGTLTFFQALATNPSIKKFLESLGMFPDEKGNITVTNSDIYALMTNAIDSFLKSKDTEFMAQDLGKETDVKQTLKDTLNLLFDDGNSAREFSKSPTMTFVYQQGKDEAVQSITTDLADNIINNLEDLNVKAYLAKLFNNRSFLLNEESMNDIEGLYVDIKKALTEKQLPQQLRELLDTAIKDKYLQQHQTRSKEIFNLVKKVLGNKVINILPAAAVLAGKKPSKDLNKYGMPIAKVFEIMHKLPDGTSVLTRQQLLHKTIMDVSTIHGIDSALLYHAIDAANLKEGVVVVHDEVRGSVEAVRAIQKEYVKKASEVLQNYDIHEQMLEALKYYSPKVVKNAEFIRLSKAVAKTVAEKKKMSKDFNLKTTALIGEGDAYIEFAKGNNNTTQETKPTTAREFLQTLSKDSDLIRTFLNVFDTKVKISKEFSYNPSLDEISINPDSADIKGSIEAVEHEIVHAATVAQVRNILNGKGKIDETNDIKYIQKTIKSLKSYDRMLSTEAQNRLDYIFSQPTEEQQIGEFLSIMYAEKEVASEIYQTLGRSSVRHTIHRFVNRLITYIKKITQEDFDQLVEAEVVYGAVYRTVNKGILDRVDRQQETQAMLKEVKTTFGYGKKDKPVDIDFLDNAVAHLLTRKAEEKGKGLFSTVHNNLDTNFPVYSAVVDKIRGIYDSSEDLQQLMHTITGEDVDKSKKAKHLAEYAKVSMNRDNFIDKNQKTFDNITKKMSDKDKETLDSLISKVPMYDYFVQAGDLNTKQKIDDAVETLEKSLGKKSEAVKDVNSLIELNLHDKTDRDIYNLQNYATNTEYHLKVRKLLALKSIQALGAEDVLSVLSNTELALKLEDLVMANYLSILGISGREHLRANMIPHSFAEGLQTRAITLKELSQYEYGENTGWVIQQKPTETSLGLVYRKVIDSTSIPGIFTDVKMSSSDISVVPEMSKFDNVIKTATGHKMIMSDESRKAMGSLGSVQSLIKSTAHAVSIQESEIIRKELLKDETTFKVNLDNMKDLDTALKDKTQDNPWFLKADGITYGDLSKEAKAKYKPVGKRVSDINNFNEQVTFVRKDISHWLLGGDRASPFVNPKWKWGLRVTKDLVSMSKIGMIILNPGKIARDNVSNIAYLGVMGVGPTFALNSYTDIIKNFGEYTELKDKLVQMKLQVIAKPNSVAIQKRYKALQDRINKNPISDVVDKGFLNSLGSSLVARDSESLGNTQRDVDTALNFLLKNSKGNNNVVSHFMMQLQKVGFRGEDFLGYLGSVVGKHKAGKKLDIELNKIMERMKQIRTDKDMTAYATQFINSPQSQVVRFGANITDLTDVLAKETLYRYFIDSGMKSETAKIKVLDSFPNYDENMPLAIQQASDLGIIMFPSYWLRIQKVIYRMAKNRPVSLATEHAIDSYFSTHINSIVDSNIVNKATSWSGILHTPFESAQFGEAAGILPTNVLSL